MSLLLKSQVYCTEKTLTMNPRNSMSAFARFCDKLAFLMLLQQLSRHRSKMPEWCKVLIRRKLKHVRRPLKNPLGPQVDQFQTRFPAEKSPTKLDATLARATAKITGSIEILVGPSES